MAQEGISEDAARKILQKDYENLIRKVAAGKNLTSAERARVEAWAAGSSQASTHVRTIDDLAQALGVTRRTLSNWRKLTGAPEPKANGQYDVLAWREFVRVRGLKSGAESIGDAESLKARKLLIDIEDRELKVAIRRGDYVPIEEVRLTWTSEVAKAIALLRKKFENELPPLIAGKDAVAIQHEAAKVIDEVCGLLNRG